MINVFLARCLTMLTILKQISFYIHDLKISECTFEFSNSIYGMKLQLGPVIALDNRRQIDGDHFF